MKKWIKYILKQLFGYKKCPYCNGSGFRVDVWTISDYCDGTGLL